MILIGRLTLIILLLCFTLHVHTLYEDQAGLVDWHNPLLGVPVSVDFIRNDEVMLIQSLNAIGAIHVSTNKLAWRYLQPHKHTLITSCNCVNAFFTAWSTPQGTLIQAYNAISGKIESQAYLTSDDNNKGLTMTCGPGDQVTAFVNQKIHLFRPNPALPGTMQIKTWDIGYTIQSLKWHRSNIIVLAHDNDKYFLFNVPMADAVTNTLISPMTQYYSLSFAGCSKNSWIVAISNDSVHFLHISDLGVATRVKSTGLVEKHIGTGGIEIKSVAESCYVQFNSQKQTLVLYLHLNHQTVHYSGDRALRVALNSATRHLQLVYPSKIISSDTENNSVVQIILNLQHANDVQLKSAYFGSYSSNKVAAVTVDGNLHLYENGLHSYTRLEGLTSIQQALVLEYPDAKTFGVQEDKAGIMAGWLFRWNKHVEQIVSFFHSLVELTTFNSASSTVYDQKFGFKKVLVLVTKHNSLVAMDTSTGIVLWQIHLPHSISKAHVVQSANLGEAVYLSVESNNDMKAFDPFTGKSVSVPQALLNQNLKDSPNFKYRIRGMKIQGYGRLDGIGNFMSTYNVTLPGEKLVAVSVPRVSTVASAGRVLENRSVLYKVLNENHIAMAVQQGSDSLAVFILDVRDGRILGHFTKNEVDFAQPIHLLRFEHWTLVTYWNKSRLGPFGWTVTIVEMLQPNAEAAAHVHEYGAAKPMLQLASFGLHVRDTIISTSVSVTRNGATVPDILYMSSRSISTLSRRLTDALTHVDTGTPPLPHMLPAGLDDRNVISHLLEVRGSQLVSAPTELESTSVVCSYGFDVFCTRILPSGAFDQLADTFPKDTLVITCCALLISTLVMQKVLHKSKMALKWS